MSAAGGSALNRTGFGLDSSLVSAIQAIIETNYIKYTAGVAQGFINADGTATSAADNSWNVNTVYDAGTFKAQISALTLGLHPLLGTANQIVITADGATPANYTFSLPQNIHAGATPTFAGLVGAIDGSSQAVGSVGEYVETDIAVGAQVAMVTATAKTVASLVLQPGRWLIQGVVAFNGDGTTTSQVLAAGIGTVTNTTPAVKYNNQQSRTSSVPAVMPVVPTPARYVTISVATTYYLIAYCTFGVAAMNCYGNINAIRQG